MKKKIIVSFIFVLYLAARFAVKYIENEPESKPEDEKVVISLESGIEKYSPAMSSVPGLPVIIRYVANIPLSQEDVYINVKASKGSFIQLIDGQITPIDDYVQLSEQEITLYWNPIEKGDLFDVAQSTVRVNLYVNDLENLKASAEGKIELDPNEYYRFKNVQTVREGIYVLKETGMEIAYRSPHVTLINKEFTFFGGGIGSDLSMGTYTVDKNMLILTTNNEEDVFVFVIEEDRLIFQEKISSEIHMMISGMGIEVEDQGEFLLETKF